ncbi:MAG: hypothetical protein U9R74_08175 [Pseudomonadota bacterium]|nr:hypothetical protein [Pseudomonadota bacterium]
MARQTVLAATLVGLALFVPARAFAQEPDDGWKFSITPYLWLPSLSGDLNYGPPPEGGGSPSVSIDASDILDNLELALMLGGTASKGRWLIGTDVIYLDFSGAKSKVQSVDLNPGQGDINIGTADLNAGTDSSLTGWLWTLAGGYAVVQKPKLDLAVLAGFRYFGLDSKTNWQLTGTVTGTGPGGNTATFARTGTTKKSEDIWTGIAGIRGQYHLGDSNWFTNFYADVGGASSTFTWQGMAGIGYAFGWGDVLLDYRYLYYSQSGDQLVDNLSFGGLALGARFRF